MRQATLKHKNNRAATPDRTLAELVNYAPAEVYVFIQELLSHVFKNHQSLDIGRRSICSLYQPVKPKDLVKNLRPAILLNMLRKIISIILLKPMKQKNEDYISQSQSVYISNRSTIYVAWADRWIIAKIQKEEAQVHITGIDMSSALDTIISTDLTEIQENILPED